jgi:hypothetical protein
MRWCARAARTVRFSSASLCRGEYLPELMRLNRHRIQAQDLKALMYQVKNGELILR